MVFVLVNVLDVLEGFFGELPSKATVLGLSREQIEELGELAMASASVLADDALDEPAVSRISSSHPHPGPVPTRCGPATADRGALPA